MRITNLPLPRLSKQALRKENSRFYGTEESHSSFLRIYATEGEYKENIYKVKKNSKSNLIISIIRAIYKPNTIFVDICNIKNKLFTLSKAIDICFKSFIIFNINFQEFYQLQNKYKEAYCKICYPHAYLSN